MRRAIPTEHQRVIALHFESNTLMGAVLAAVRRREWTPLDLTLTGAGSLSRIAPAAAIVGPLPEDSPEWEALRTAGCPLVQLDYPPKRSCPVPTVMRDLAAEGRLAAEHFVDRGFTSVGFVGYTPWGDAKGLYDAFSARSRELGRTCRLLQFSVMGGEPYSMQKQTRYEQRLPEFKAWIEASPLPLGLLSWGDLGAAVQCEMCLHLGYEVPDDVAILAAGFDTSRCECAPVPLSSIGVDVESMVETAFGMLDDMLAGQHVPPERILIPPKAITCRESTNVLAVTDRDVARALRYIRAHYDAKFLGVDDIAAAVDIPARSLRRAFQRELGRGINAELRRWRMEQARELLRSTKRKIADIAPLVGIRTSEYFHTAFRKAYGMTPQQYRRRETQQA